MSNYRRLYLKNYNYIFFTIVTFDRKNILFDNINLLRNALKYALKKYEFEIYAIVVMDNHIHCILNISDINIFSKIIYSIKYNFSVHLGNNTNISESKQKKGEKGIWQRRFYDHIIRDENDLYKHVDYIHFNPVKHNYVKSPKDFPYSSFNKFVSLGYYDEDWCNLEDKNKISKMNLE